MEYKIYVGEKTEVRATACSVAASNCQTEGTHNKYHTFWMKPNFLAIVYAIDSSVLTIYWFSNESSTFLVSFLMEMQVY